MVGSGTAEWTIAAAANVGPCRTLDHFTPTERSRSDERNSILHSRQSQTCAYVSASSEDRAGFHLHSSGWYHLGFGWLDQSSIHHSKMALVDSDVPLHAFAREALRSQCGAGTQAKAQGYFHRMRYPAKQRLLPPDGYGTRRVVPDGVTARRGGCPSTSQTTASGDDCSAVCCWQI